MGVLSRTGNDLDMVASEIYKVIPVKMWQKITGLSLDSPSPPADNDLFDEGIIKLTFFDGSLYRYKKSISMYLTLQELL